MAGSSHRREALDTLERSIMMAPVQRKGLVVVLLALVLSVHSIGWLALLPLVGSFVAFVVIKAPPVQRRLGIWSLVTVWTLGQAGIVGGVLLSANPAQYLIGMIALPTILGSVVWPRRWVIAAAVVTAALMLGVGVAADPANFANHPAAFLFATIVGVSAALLTLIARGAEAASRQGTRTDGLTGVGNRVALAELRQRLDDGDQEGGVAVLVVDVDRFKSINDRFGHEVGDDTLKRVAALIAETVGTAGAVFRFGGEEFVAILQGLESARAVTMGESIRAAIADADGEVPVTASIGVAHSPNATPGVIDALLAQADARLYCAKRQGRNRVVGDDAPEGECGRRAADTEPIARVVVPHDVWDPPELDQDAPVQVGLGVRRALARLHLISMTERQHRTDRVLYAILAIVLSALLPIVGWKLLIPVAVGASLYRLAQRFVHRYSRPELTLGIAWMISQAAYGVALVMADRPVLAALPVLAIMVVASSAAYPRRYTVVGTAYTVVLIVVVALVIDPAVLVHAPEAVTTAVALTICAAITGHAVGRLASTMRSVASHDQLTGLPNSVACAAAATALMIRWRDEGAPCAVLIGDLDHFKQVNDTAGHVQGDAVLVDLVRRLSEHLRGDAMVFRTGGEEFAVLLAGVHAPAAVQAAERLRQAVAASPLAGQAVTISFGVAVAHGDDGMDYGLMFRRADAALYQAKRAGRNCVRLAEGWSLASLGVTPAPMGATLVAGEAPRR